MPEEEQRPASPPSGGRGPRVDATAARAAVNRLFHQFSTERGRLQRKYDPKSGGMLGSFIGDLNYQAGHIALIAICGLIVTLFVAVIGLIFGSTDGTKIESI